MGKYEPLERYLRDCAATEVPMSFAEIEEVIGAELPDAAHAHRAWWSNNPSNNVMTRSWLAAGYVTERVDMGSQKLVFRRSDKASASAAETRSEERPKRRLLDQLRARLAGTITVQAGVDLTEPTGEVWDAER